MLCLEGSQNSVVLVLLLVVGGGAEAKFRLYQGISVSYGGARSLRDSVYVFLYSPLFTA